MTAATISLVILTYRRNYLLERHLAALEPWHQAFEQVIVVDNAGEPPAAEVCVRYPWVTLVRAPRNLGAAGRNLGFDAARSDYVVTLDDDVVELQPEHLDTLRRLFADRGVSCINFKVVEEGTGRLVNWVHHRDAATYSDKTFATYEITEGAVAFRRECLEAVGGYPESFFLSHEGPDLAYRLMDRGWQVIYSPEVVVTHLFAPEGRASWRNYYYDTRNTLWLVVRHLPLLYGMKMLIRQNCAMAFYALRDGFFLTWLKAWWHALAGLPREYKTRKCLSANTMRQIRAIDAHRPGFWQLVWERIRSPNLRLEVK
jgi:GT2 family glycosyltransferase